MASYPIHLVAEYQDINGDVATVRVPDFVIDTTTVAALITLADGLTTTIGAPGTMTNSTLIRKGVTIFDSELDPLAIPALDAEFPSVADKARITLASGTTGSHTSFSLPAPVEAVFHAPPADENVNPAGAASALIVWLQGHARDVANSLFAVYVGGVRQKSRARRRKSHRL